jgi:hypothetical protein
VPHIRDRRAAGLAVLLALLGTVSITMGLRVEAEALPPVSVPDPTSAAPPPVASRSAAPPAPARALPRSAPVRLDIPAIKLRTRLTELGLERDGTIEVPPLRADAPAGWYRHSPTPGEPGAAVIIGHVDTAREGPAVFFRLRELQAGDTISVRRKDGHVSRFSVTRVASYPKQEFPTTEVYGPLDHPALRLVTCGGSFDRTKGSYRSNVVVYAEAI